FCAPSGTQLERERVEFISDRLADLSTMDRHIINGAASNFGAIEIDAEHRRIRLAIHDQLSEIIAYSIAY
ncbi:MAG: hypothetical protein KDK34_21165, partial [Leptospiraceae bacterium]|nr:hypothetical protein [Leptospiraceae bacterium]